MKRRTSSIKRENDRTKKTFLEEAISGQSTESEFQSASIEKPLEKLFHSIDKAIDCTRKIKDVKRQYRLSHYYHSISKKPAVNPTFVKIPPKKKTREEPVSSDISFAPQKNVIMETVSENISAETYYETDIAENKSDPNPNYYPYHSNGTDQTSTKRDERLWISTWRKIGWVLKGGKRE